MRILQLAPIWETVPPPGYGGTESVISVLTEELVARGHDVVLAASGDSMTSAELLAVQPHSLRPAGLAAESLQYSLVHVAKALRQAGDFDVIHNHSGPPFELGMAMSHLVDTPFLTTLHNHPSEETRFIWSHYEGWYNTISARQAACIEPLPRARFAGVAHNAIDVESFPFLASKQEFALFLGRFIDYKGPHLAIDAAERAGLPIVLAGKIALPEEREYFERCIRPRLRPGHVEYVGEAGAIEKRELLGNARVLLMPLLWDEPFGLVMSEAMACGTPVVAYRRGAAPEIIDDGRTGYLVDDIEEMIAAIECLDAIDPLACRAHVEQHFSPRALADRYLDLYARIAGGITEVEYDRILA
ncbi:MAG: glycosyltransferase family 4 protein [Dehalococcoidia bacterium]